MSVSPVFGNSIAAFYFEKICEANMKNYDLGTEKIGLLIRHFSVPCVISRLVVALYNVVDQIFIGWSEAGAFGNAATNIVYPFTVLALGLA